MKAPLEMKKVAHVAFGLAAAGSLALLTLALCIPIAVVEVWRRLSLKGTTTK